MCKHTGGGSVNTCRISQFWLAELANTCRKAKGRLAQLFFPNAGYDLGHPDSVISKHRSFTRTLGWVTKTGTRGERSRPNQRKQRNCGDDLGAVRAACARWAWRQRENCSVKSFFRKKAKDKCKSEPSKCSRLAISRLRQSYAMIGVELRTHGEIFVKSWRRKCSFAYVSYSSKDHCHCRSDQL